VRREALFRDGRAPTAKRSAVSLVSTVKLAPAHRVYVPERRSSDDRRFEQTLHDMIESWSTRDEAGDGRLPKGETEPGSHLARQSMHFVRPQVDPPCQSFLVVHRILAASKSMKCKRQLFHPRDHGQESPICPALRTLKTAQAQCRAQSAAGSSPDHPVCRAACRCR
jgi:hypothetical protein